MIFLEQKWRENNTKTLSLSGFCCFFSSCFRFYSFRFLYVFSLRHWSWTWGKRSNSFRCPDRNRKTEDRRDRTDRCCSCWTAAYEMLQLVALALLALLALGPEVAEQCFKLWWSKNTKNMNFISSKSCTEH